MLGAKPAYLDAMFASIEKRYASTEAYLLASGLNKIDLAWLRSKLQVAPGRNEGV